MGIVRGRSGANPTGKRRNLLLQRTPECGRLKPCDIRLCGRREGGYRISAGGEVEFVRAINLSNGGIRGAWLKGAKMSGRGNRGSNGFEPRSRLPVYSVRSERQAGYEGVGNDLHHLLESLLQTDVRDHGYSVTRRLLYEMRL